MKSRLLRALLPMVAALAVCLGGCKDDNREPKYKVRDGIVSKIDRETGEVEMRVYVEKLQKELEVSGRLAPNAEILINGETARLEQVNVGDKVTVTAREEKDDNDRKLVAVKVEVTRPLETTDAPAPATQPQP